MPFDAVLMLSCVSDKGQIKVMHLIQHHPNPGLNSAGKPAMSQVDFDTASGNGDVKYHGIEIEDLG